MSTATLTPRVINRWVVLAASAAVLLCTGAIYSFSVFSGPLADAKGWDITAVVTAYSINSAIAPIPMILGGLWCDRKGARWLVLLGGVLFGLGWVLAAMSTSLVMLYLSYGLIAGTGQGLAYSGALNNTLRFFPDRRGMAAGLITGANGAATIIAAPLIRSLITSSGVVTALTVMGFVYMGVGVVAFFFVRVAPDGFKPAGWVQPASTTAAGRITNQNWSQMMRRPIFWAIFLMFICGAFSGLMIAANASPIGQSMYGLVPATAALFVSLYALANMSGRIVFGAVSDRIGHVRTVMIIFGVVALSLAVLVLVKGNSAGFAIGLIGLGLCFGGVMGVFPPLVMGNFGAKNQGVNYGIAFSAYAIAAFFAPKMAAGIGKSHAGDYTTAFIIAIVAAVIGFGLAFLLKRLMATRDRKLMEPDVSPIAPVLPTVSV